MNRFLQFLQQRWESKNIYSWQTLLLMSSFSLLLALATRNIVQRMIFSGGWIFLSFGVRWWTKENNIIVGPWLTGFILCLGIWILLFPLIQFPWVLIYFPLVSALIAVIPSFFDGNLDFKVPSSSERQILVFLFGSQLLISSWIHFGFILQTWLQQYPTFMALDMSQSSFISKVEVRPSPPRGVILLDRLEPLLIEELADQPWSATERWLLQTGRGERLQGLIQRASEEPDWDDFLNLEGKLWQVKADAISQDLGYDLKLQVIWQGPGQGDEEKSGEKNCRIMPTISSAMTTVNCSQTTLKGWRQ